MGLTEGDTGEETTLSETKSGTSSKQSVVVLYNTEKSGANTPNDHDERDPESGTSALHHHVTRDLSEHVEGEEDGQGNLIIVSHLIDQISECYSTYVVIQTLHVKTLLESSKTSISDVGTVEERKKVQQSQERQQSQVDLSYKASGCLVIKKMLLL